MLRSVEVALERQEASASVVLLAGCRTADSVCMHSSAVAWDLADVEAAQDSSLLYAHVRDVDLLLTMAASATCLVALAKVLVETAAWLHYASAATAAACHV